MNFDPGLLMGVAFTLALPIIIVMLVILVGLIVTGFILAILGVSGAVASASIKNVLAKRLILIGFVLLLIIGLLCILPIFLPLVLINVGLDYGITSLVITVVLSVAAGVWALAGFKTSGKIVNSIAKFILKLVFCVVSVAGFLLALVFIIMLIAAIL